MGTIWARQDPGGLHVGPMNYAIWVVSRMVCEVFCSELYASLACYQLYINPLLNTKLIMFHGQWKYSINIMVRISMTNLAEIYNFTISPNYVWMHLQHEIGTPLHHEMCASYTWITSKI